MYIESWGNKAAEEIWEHEKSDAVPRELWERAKLLLTIMYHENQLKLMADRGMPPRTNLHKYKGTEATWSIDILGRKNPWRILFEFEDGKYHNVRIVDPHKG